MSTEPRIDERRVRAALDEIARGAAATPNSIPEPGSAAAPRMTASRLAMVAAVVALVVGAGALLVRRNAPEAITDQPPEDPTADATAQWFTDLEPDSVAPLPDAPIAGRFGPASVWTGSEMIVWGGAHTTDGGEEPLDDGAAFDPMTGAWRVLPDAPIEGRAYASTIWTGSEMVVWGGSRGGEFVSDGAAYDPITDTWRVIAASPKPAAMKSAVAWTGTEMIVIGGLNQGGAAAAYDPTADAWRSLPDAPGSVPPPYPQAVWTDEAVLVPMVQGASTGDRVSLAMYRPDVDEWEVVQTDLPTRFIVATPGVELGMVGTEAVGLTAESDVPLPVLSLFGDIGSELAPIPADHQAPNFWQPVWTGHEILLWSGGEVGSAIDPLGDDWSGSWRQFDAGALTIRVDAALVWADGVLLAWGGFELEAGATAADGIVYRPAEPPASSDEPDVTVPPIDTVDGCPDDHPGDWRPGDDGFTDYVDFVQIDGRMYSAVTASALEADQLGEVVGQVCFTLGQMTFDGSAPMQDGDASFLPVGTELRAIPGGDPGLRVAAVSGQGVQIYEVLQIEGAERGADLLDLAGVVEIWVASDIDGSRIAQLDAGDTNALIQQLADAPVDLSPRPESERNGERYFIELDREDGTTTSRAFWIQTGEMFPGIDLPRSWQDAVRAAVDGDTSAVPIGDAATWTVASENPPSPDASTFTALVSRLGCNGGVTGKVLEPTVDAGDGEVVVTFTVEPVDGPQPCPGNIGVPVTVELSEPIGTRILVDGACRSDEAASTTFCVDGATRWSP